MKATLILAAILVASLFSSGCVNLADVKQHLAAPSTQQPYPPYGNGHDNDYGWDGNLRPYTPARIR